MYAPTRYAGSGMELSDWASPERSTFRDRALGVPTVRFEPPGTEEPMVRTVGSGTEPPCGSILDGVCSVRLGTEMLYSNFDPV